MTLRIKVVAAKNVELVGRTLNESVMVAPCLFMSADTAETARASVRVSFLIAR